jgi:capsular exopolysaccharide synthesis family protein
MEQNNYLVENAQEEEISLVDIFFHYLKYWVFFVLSVVICMGLAYVYLRYTTPEYNVSSKIQISDEKRGNSSVDMTAFEDLGIITAKNNLDNEIEVLNSKTLMRGVVDSLRIGVSYFKEGKITKTEVYKNSPFFVTLSNIEKTGSFTVDLISRDTLSVRSLKEKFERTVEVGQELSSPWGLLVFELNPFGTQNYPIEVVINSPKSLPAILIKPVNKASSVVEISITTSCPPKGQDIINTLIEHYNKNTISEKNYVAKNTIDFINERLLDISDELKTAEKEVEDYQQKQGITDLQAQGQLLLSSSTEYDKKINDASIQLDILHSIKSFLTAPANAGNMAPANVGLTDHTILSLIHTYNSELTEKNKTTSGMKAGNPTLIEAENRVASIRENLLKGIELSESSMVINIRELRKQENMYLGKARGLSTQERESRGLYRNQSLKETLFNYLSQKREETGLALVLATPNAKVIDPAEFSSIPVKPKKSVILLAALILALIIPVVIIYIRDLFDNKIHTKEDITRVVKAPFLGDIPLVKTKEPFPVLKARSSIAEKFRVISSNLDFVTGNEKTKIISITSTTSGEGKSFFSFNLAMSLATMGKKTLLVDLDIRKSTMKKILDIKVDKGSVIFLSHSETNRDEIIDKSGTYHPCLDIIPVKIFPPNPAELLASDRLEQLFREVERDYEYIIIDMAPVGLVADAFRINHIATATIFLVRADYTYKQTLPEIQELYRDNKLCKLSVVLNASESSNKYGYGYSNYKHNYYTEE